MTESMVKKEKKRKKSSSMKLPQIARDRIFFVKGVFFGLYGNWIISFIEKIPFSDQSFFAQIQLILILLSLAILLYYVIYSLEPTLINLKNSALSILGHYISLFTTIWIGLINTDIVTVFPKPYSFIAFLLIGIFILMILAGLDLAISTFLKESKVK